MEQLLECDLLHIGFRQKILEIVTGLVFNQVMSLSSGPQVELFKPMKEKGQFIYPNTFQHCSSDKSEVSAVADTRDEIIKSLKGN